MTGRHLGNRQRVRPGGSEDRPRQDSTHIVRPATGQRGGNHVIHRRLGDATGRRCHPGETRSRPEQTSHSTRKPPPRDDAADKMSGNSVDEFMRIFFEGVEKIKGSGVDLDIAFIEGGNSDDANIEIIARGFDE